ncbi:glycosyltransferase family 2 protein, partial [uncultured Thiodictyon sp.]|uniref:glycosyltransferase family 2 protein n=1 Tax=uncultured Thiodictyon sp. TaxID=1846217 RepID=UPI0025CD1EDF
MTKDPELVQICLPTYNGAAHLAEALDSLLAQTHQNIEITIMDNASTDETPAIARHYEGKDARIRYFRAQEFVCATDNWNRAFRKLDSQRSRFFMWASDDDLWSQNYIEKLLGPLRSDEGLALSYSWFDSIESNGHLSVVSGYRSIFPIGSAFKRVRSLIRTGQYCAIYGITRFSAISWEPCLADVTFGADLWYMIQLCDAGRFEITKEPLFFKRAGGISATNDDPSASRDPRVVWNIGKADWTAISKLHFNVLTKLYIYNRLRISAKLLYPQ